MSGGAAHECCGCGRAGAVDACDGICGDCLPRWVEIGKHHSWCDCADCKWRQGVSHRRLHRQYVKIRQQRGWEG